MHDFTAGLICVTLSRSSLTFPDRFNEGRALRERVAEQDAELQAMTVDLVTRSRADMERKLHDSRFARPAASIRPSASSAALPPVTVTSSSSLASLGSSPSSRGLFRRS
jgi:hypothetical protein